MHAKSFQLCPILTTPRTVACQALCPWDFPGKNTGVGGHFPSPGDLPNPGFKPGSPALQADSLQLEPHPNLKPQLTKAAISCLSSLHLHIFT